MTFGTRNHPKKAGHRWGLVTGSLTTRAVMRTLFPVGSYAQTAHGMRQQSSCSTFTYVLEEWASKKEALAGGMTQASEKCGRIINIKKMESDACYSVTLMS